MLKLADLAQRPDLQLGPMLVSPSRRLIEGPGGRTSLEPLIMQVFLMLLDARGKVVTRTDLFDQCWGGVMVGDDSLNRAIAKVRRTGAEVAPGLFEIETIPRTGYRLVGDILAVQPAPDGPGAADRRPFLSRRGAVAGGIAAAAAATAGVGLWTALRPRSGDRFETLMKSGEEALRLETDGAATYFEQAVAIRPDDARALGLLAYALASLSDYGSASGDAGAQEAASAARAALAIDSRDPHALTAMIFLQRGMLDWIAHEDAYRRVLAIDPDNIFAMRNLSQMLHGVGRSRDAYAMGERALAIEPMSPPLQTLRALRLWVFGRVADAYRVSNRTMDLWPSNRFVRLGRLMIYAFTGRQRAALALIEDEETAPRLLSPAAASVWRTSLLALENPTPSRVAAARHANLEGAKTTPATAAWAILVLSALGELDAAFGVANGFLLARGPLVVRPKPTSGAPSVNHPGWRNTYGLFTPPTAAMRRDRRFGPLCDGLGLTDYWRRRGIGPDPFLFKA